MNNATPESTKAQGLSPEEIWLVVLKTWPVRCAAGLTSVALPSGGLSVAEQTAQVSILYLEPESRILHKKKAT